MPDDTTPADEATAVNEDKAAAAERDAPVIHPDALTQPDRGTDEFTDSLQQVRANPYVVPKGVTADGNDPAIMHQRAQEAPRVTYDAGANEQGREWLFDGGSMRRMTDDDIKDVTEANKTPRRRR